MNTKTTLSLAAASLLLSAVLMGGNAQAEDQTNPLQFYTGANGSYAKVTLEADLGFFAQSNSWFGNDVGVLGTKSNSWWESLIRPGIDVNYVLPSTQTIYAQLDAVQANTFGGTDAAASNIDYSDDSLRIEHAYVGWKSGNLFSALGEDFLDISFGRQSYVVGNGFLFANQGGSGFGRAAFWVGGRNSADYAGIIKMKSGNWVADLTYFEADDNPDSDTKVGGGNVAYNVENMGYLGAGLYTVESDIIARDSMLVYNVRGGVNPFALMGGMDVLKPLHFEMEYVYEDRDSGFQSGNAWYASVGYEVENCPWKPGLTYRYASFDQDYDALYYGSTGWETWYQGEILGEYAIGNNDLDSHMLKLTLKPLDAVTLTLAYLNYDRHQSGDDYAQEYDLIVDWAVNDHLSLSVVGGIADPDDAATLETGGDDNWSYMMMFGSIKF
ncbi:MAG: hypothetical protein PHI97_32240 [Desulfobulbus sp.]|nr:hypothetical protein [Desulfobulbus sp.]